MSRLAQQAAIAGRVFIVIDLRKPKGMLAKPCCKAISQARDLEINWCE